MAFDGSRALIVGDYITPASGDHAGQLGPWSSLVSAIGIQPRSTLMMSFFALYGLAWLIVLLSFVRAAPWSGSAMLIAAVGALWYLPFGTLFSGFQILLLWLLGRRQAPLTSSDLPEHDPAGEIFSN